MLEPQRSIAELTHRGNVLTVSFAVASLGSLEAARLVEEVVPELARLGRRVRHVVLDFSIVTYVNSAALGACIDVRNRADEQQATTSAVGLNPDLLKLFQMMKLGKVFALEAARADQA